MGSCYIKHRRPVGLVQHKDLAKCAGKAAEACDLFNLLKVACCAYGKEGRPFPFKRKINTESYN